MELWLVRNFNILYLLGKGCAGGGEGKWKAEKGQLFHRRSQRRDGRIFVLGKQRAFVFFVFVFVEDDAMDNWC